MGRWIRTMRLMAERHYPHPLIDRYASSEMAAIFSPRMQALVWRDLWIALAEEERALGVDIPNDAIVAMHAAREQIDLDRIAVIERDLRHDVMAHVHHFGEVAPEARKYIHLGATSAFVGDNHGLIQHRQGLDIVRDRCWGRSKTSRHSPVSRPPSPRSATRTCSRPSP